jgi:hypothetical protein
MLQKVEDGCGATTGEVEIRRLGGSQLEVSPGKKLARPHLNKNGRPYLKNESKKGCRHGSIGRDPA